MYSAITKLTLIFLLLMFGQMISAQTKSSDKSTKSPTKQTSVEDYQKIVTQESAINLAVDVGQEANKLTDSRQKIVLKLEAAKVLTRPQPNSAVKILESAWQDANDASTEKEIYDVAALRDSILDLAKQLAPDKAKKWLEQTKETKTDETDDENKNLSPDQIKRQTADALASSALAKINSQPQQAVSELVASFQRTGKLSSYLVDAVKALNEKNQSQLSERLKQSLADYVLTRTSDDVADLRVIVSFLVSSGELNSIARSNMLAFLMASTRQILVNQSLNGQTPKIPENKISELYTVYRVFLRPTVEKFSGGNLPAFDDLLSELAAFVPASKLDAPALSSESIEKQIESAKRITGFEQRDARLVKIAGWLLSGKLRDKENSLKLASDVAAEITDDKAKENLYDAIKFVEFEKLFQSKDFSAAEKKADRIVNLEWRAWALAVLGKVQESNPQIAAELYEKSLQSLRKAWASAHRARLGFLVASLEVKQNPLSTLETLTQAVAFANQAPEKTDKIPLQKTVLLAVEAGEYGFASTEAETDIEEIALPENLGKIAVSNWNEILQTGKNIQNSTLRLRFQLLTARAVLKDFSPDAKKTVSSTN